MCLCYAFRPLVGFSPNNLQNRLSEDFELRCFLPQALLRIVFMLRDDTRVVKQRSGVHISCPILGYVSKPVNRQHNPCDRKRSQTKVGWYLCHSWE